MKTEITGNDEIPLQFPAGKLRFWTAAALLFAALLSQAATNQESADDIPALLPPRAEIPPGFMEQYGWTMAACGVGLLVVTGLIVRFSRRSGPVAALPPEVLARRTLEALRRQPVDGATLSQVSRVLRHYTAAVFGLPPGEFTTAEFHRAMAGNRQINPELSAKLACFLRECDEWKFAPSVPSPPPDAVARALELVEFAETTRAKSIQPAQPA